MREEEKPFVCYKQGWNMKIVPRNAAGWRALGIWTLALLFPTFAMLPFVARVDDTPREYLAIWAIVPLLLVTAAIGIFMVRWMKARSEIIDIDEVLKIKREQDRKAKRRG